MDEDVVGEISAGLLVYLGVGKHDDETHVDRMVEKLTTLRVFEDDAGKMSRSVTDIGGEVLVVSQFTLFGDVRKGRRPSFDQAAEPARAEALYELVCRRIRHAGLRVETGRFRAMMNVRAEVDGPITILIDSDKTF